VGGGDAGRALRRVAVADGDEVLGLCGLKSEEREREREREIGAGFGKNFFFKKKTTPKFKNYFRATYAAACTITLHVA